MNKPDKDGFVERPVRMELPTEINPAKKPRYEMNFSERVKLSTLRGKAKKAFVKEMKAKYES